VTFCEKVGQKKGSTFLKSRVKIGICCSKVGTVGLFSYVYIDKLGKKIPLSGGGGGKNRNFNTIY